MQKQHTGIFISIEGIEGAGKSSAMQTVIQWLEDKNISVTTTREPGGTIVAEKIRNLILDNHAEPMNKITELLLMFAARSQNIHNCIFPALKLGHAVVTDRFTDASFAYQHGGRGIDEATIATLENMVQQQLRPDLVILLDVDVAIGMSRIRNRSKATMQQPDRIEQEKLSFFTKVKQCYLQRADKFPERFAVIDANKDYSAVSEQITTVLTKKLRDL